MSMYCSFFIYVSYCFSYWVWLWLFFPVIFLVFSVCEGALGLSILVSMIRSHGNDFFNTFGLSLC